MSPVARGLPEIRLENIGADNLVKGSLLVLAPNQFQQSIVNSGAVRQEEARTRRSLVEEEELLLQTNLSVVALRSLFKECLVLLKLLLVRERNTRNSLDRFVGAVAEPVCGRVL